MAPIPRAIESIGFALHQRQLQQRLVQRTIRQASSTADIHPKPRVLAKPDRFNPPSHGKRLPKQVKTYGAPISQEQREVQRTKQYPHMMPPEGSFMHWFLTNRMIHVFISMAVLLSLVVSMWWQNFIYNTPYKELLPPNNMFFAHPIQFLMRYADVYEMTTAYNTQRVMDRRKAQFEDVQKRRDYRKAHGMDDGSKPGFLGIVWNAEAKPAPQPALGSDASPVSSDVVQNSIPKDVELQGELDAPVASAISDINTEKVSTRPKWFGIF